MNEGVWYTLSLISLKIRNDLFFISDSQASPTQSVDDSQASPSSTPVNCSQGSLTSPAADEQSDATHELTGTLRCTPVSKPLPSGGNYSEMGEFTI